MLQSCVPHWAAVYQYKVHARACIPAISAQRKQSLGMCRLYKVWSKIWERILAMPMPDESDISLAANLRRLDTVKDSMLISSCSHRGPENFDYTWNHMWNAVHAAAQS